jgi:hypothetical protein
MISLKSTNFGHILEKIGKKLKAGPTAASESACFQEDMLLFKKTHHPLERI